MIKNLEKYYGLKYTSQILVDMIAQYIQSTGVMPVTAFEQIVLSFKGQYNKLPDVAAIKEIIEGSPELKRQLEVFEDEEGNVWSKGRRIGHVDAGKFCPRYADGVPDDVRQLDHTTPENLIKFLEVSGRSLFPIDTEEAEE